MAPHQYNWQQKQVQVLAEEPGPQCRTQRIVRQNSKGAGTHREPTKTQRNQLMSKHQQTQLHPDWPEWNDLGEERCMGVGGGCAIREYRTPFISEDMRS